MATQRTQQIASIPMPTLGASGTTIGPQQLTEYLRAVIAKIRHPRNKIPVTDRREWMNLITELADDFIASFSIKERDSPSWDILHEKISLVEVSLEVISLCKDRVEGLFNNQDGFAMKLFGQLFNLCLYLETWVDAATPTAEPLVNNVAITPPDKLCDIAFGVAGGILKTLSLEPVSVISGGEPSWKVLRDIIDVTFAISHGSTPLFLMNNWYLLMSERMIELFDLAPTSTYPLTVDFNTKPHVQDASVPRVTVNLNHG
jgi:hypothetical protein